MGKLLTVPDDKFFKTLLERDGYSRRVGVLCAAAKKRGNSGSKTPVHNNKRPLPSINRGRLPYTAVSSK